jgi:hypothetical protein
MVFRVPWIDRRAVALGLAVETVAPPVRAWVKPYKVPERPDRRPPLARAFAGALSDELLRRDVHAALVFRAGMRRRDLPPEVAYTHGGIFIRGDHSPEQPGAADAYDVYGMFAGNGVAVPRWRSMLTVESPFDFMTRAIEDDVGVVVPTPDIQDKLIAVVGSPTYEALRIDRYSVVANPFARKYQNCDVFVLYLVAAAAWGLSDPAEIAERLRPVFKPTVLRAARLIRALAPFVDRRVSMDDQRGQVITATYESIARFMLAEGLASDRFVQDAPTV